MGRAAVHTALGRLDEEGNFQRAEVPREEIDEAREKAAKAIAPLGHRAFGDLRPAEAEAVNAAYLEPFVRGKLEQLALADDPDLGAVEAYLAELARLLNVQGRFGEAAELHPEGERCAVAAHRPDNGDGAFCDCASECVTDPAGTSLRQLLFERDEQLSEVHGGIVYRWRCKCCGDLNISPEPPPQDAWFYERVAFHGRAELADNQVLR